MPLNTAAGTPTNLVQRPASFSRFAYGGGPSTSITPHGVDGYGYRPGLPSSSPSASPFSSSLGYRGVKPHNPHVTNAATTAILSDATVYSPVRLRCEGAGGRFFGKEGVLNPHTRSYSPPPGGAPGVDRALPWGRRVEQFCGQEFFRRSEVLEMQAAEAKALAIHLVRSFAWASLMQAQSTEQQQRISIISEESVEFNAISIEHYPYRPILAYNVPRMSQNEVDRREYIKHQEYGEISALLHNEYTQRMTILITALSDNETARRGDIRGYEATDWGSLHKAHKREKEATVCEIVMQWQVPHRTHIHAEEDAAREMLGQLMYEAAKQFPCSDLMQCEARFRSLLSTDYYSGLQKLYTARSALHLAVLEGVECQWRNFHVKEYRRETKGLYKTMRFGCAGLTTGTDLFQVETDEAAEREYVEHHFASHLEQILLHEAQEKIAVSQNDLRRGKIRERKAYKREEKMLRNDMIIQQSMVITEETERKARRVLGRCALLGLEEIRHRALVEGWQVGGNVEMSATLNHLHEKWRREQQDLRARQLNAGGGYARREPPFYLSAQREADVRAVQNRFVTALPLSHRPVHVDPPAPPRSYPPLPDYVDPRQYW